MSRSFGYNGCIFFHDKVNYAIDDLNEESNYKLHKDLIPILQELYWLTYGISSVEDGDMGYGVNYVEEFHSRLDTIKDRVTELQHQIDQGEYNEEK